MEKQRQHYVPKVYLKEFSKNKLGHFYAAGPKPDYLTTINPRHVEQVCYVDNFYTLKEKTKKLENIEDADFLEKKAFDYEKRLLPRIISKLKHKNIYLNKSYYDSLIDIYLNLKQRNLFYRNGFKNSDHQSFIDKEIERMSPLKSWIEEMSGIDYDSLMGKIKEQILQDKELPEELHKQSLIDTAKGQNDAINRTKEVIKRMNLFILEPVSALDYFITSDNPGFTLLGDKVFNTNFSRFNSIGFPINSRQLVFFNGISSRSQFEIHKRINFIKIPSSEIHLINCYTAFNSNEYLFCENKKYLTEFTKKFVEENGH